jgi:hypothetical protein
VSYGGFSRGEVAALLSITSKELTMDKDFIREVEMEGLMLGADLPPQKVYERLSKKAC